MQTEHSVGAGHSKEIVKNLSKDGLLIGIDRDEEALKAAKENLKEFKNVKYIHGNHDDIQEILEEIGIKEVDGILLDLGHINQMKEIEDLVTQARIFQI